MKGFEPETGLGILVAFALIGTLFIAVTGCVFPEEESKTSVNFEEKPLKKNICFEVEKETLLYRETKYWSEDIFPEIKGNLSGFKSNQIRMFNEKFDVDPENFEATFNEENKSTVFKCNVSGKISRTGDQFTATFLWFLNPLNLDFIDNKFRETNSSLSWNGSINGVPTKIVIHLPRQNSTYQAWNQPVGHCHGHIWWPKKG